MKSIYQVLIFALSSFLVSSCVNVELVDLLPDIDLEEYCDKSNPDTDFDEFIW